MQKNAAGDFVFACSGRSLYMCMEGFGIADDLQPTCGYDDRIQIDSADEAMSPAERRELADHVIALWQRFAAEGPAVDRNFEED